MSTRLDPLVAGKLRHFGRRRILLLAVRGFCAAVVAFLICMALVAAIDWYWVLSDQVRWGLSLTAYTLTAVAVWFTCLRKLLRTPAAEEIAGHVEAAEPALRENLVSAVELATDDPDEIHDSPVFRELLQSTVAEQMTDVRVRKVLPVRMLAGWAVAALILAGVTGILLTGNDPRFRTLARRALLPGANIERVSRIKVQILQPTPESLTVPTDETVAVVVETSGGDVEEVTLETFPQGSSAERQTMRIRGESEFAANIHVEGDTQYRILAGDAVTRRYAITAKNRPRVVAFNKTYQYPDYARLETNTVREDNGDIAVIEGTRVDLALELDQTVSTAELHLRSGPGTDVEVVRLQKDQSNRWCASLPVTEPAIYKVHLVSAETGFENVFAPRYEIRPVADLIPRAGFVDQPETDLLLPPNDILALRGMGEDDLPLAGLSQEVSVNGREWETFPLQTTASEETDQETVREPLAHRLDADWQWDLLKLKLRTGDQVMTRVVATDLKGNRGESVPIRITVSAPEFDPGRHHTMELKAGLFDHLAQLDKTAQDHKAQAHEILKRLREAKDQTDQQRALDRTNLADLARKVRAASGQVLDQVREVTRVMPPGADAFELFLSGRVLARLQQEHMSRPHYLLKAMELAKDDGERKRDLDQIKRAFDRAADDANRLAHHYQFLMSHNVLAAVAADLDALLKQQQLVVNSPTQTWERLLRQQTLVRSQLRVVARLLESQRERMPAHAHNQFKQYEDWARQQIERLDSAMESEDKLPQLQQLAHTLARELGHRQRFVELDGGLPGRLTTTRRDFDHRSGTLYEAVLYTSNAIRQEAQTTIAAAKATDSQQVAELTRQARRAGAEVDLQHRDGVDQIRIRRDIAQARRDSDTQYAADMGLASRAITSLLNQYRNGDAEESIVPKAFTEVAPALRVLEAGHDLANIRLCLRNLIRLEQWDSQDITGRLDHPRQWETVYRGLEDTTRRLREAGIDRNLITRLDQIRGSRPVHESNRRLTERRWKPDHVSASSTLAELSDDLKDFSTDLQPAMAEARATIAKYAPTIPEMATQIAEQLRDLEQETTEVADAVEEPTEPRDPDAPELTDVRDAQNRINNQLDDLFEALVEDANNRDLLDAEQRERARDADDSIAMVRDPAERANRELEAAEQNAVPDEQARDLSKAAEQQEKTAKALETVAEHYERMKNGEDLAETRSQLRDAENELGIAQKMEQKFNPAEELAEQAQSDPSGRIAELEEELRKNPAMQEALSEIAKNTVQEAQNALDAAANREQEVQRANERSDAAFQEKKKELAEDLRNLGRKANEIAQQTQQANTSASQAKTPEAQKKFAAAQDRLNKAAQKAQQSNESELLSQLTDKLKETQQALQEATKELKSGETDSAAAKNNEIHADDNARKNAKTQQENQRKRFQDQRKRLADQNVRNKQNQERQAQSQVRTQQNQVRAAERQIQQAKRNLNRQPDNEGIKRQVAQAEQRKKQAEERLAAANERKQEAQQDTAAARQEREALNKVPTPPLNDKNPAAQAAEAYAKQAGDDAAKLAKQAEELAKSVDFGEQLNPSAGQLQYAQNEQNAVTGEVGQAAENVDRAARHERRLDNTQAAAELGEAAENVRGVAQNETPDAGQQLAKAQQAAAANAAAPKDPAEAPQGNQQAVAANQKLATAEEAIDAQAEALGELLAQAEAAAAGTPTAPAEGQPQQPGEGSPQQPGEGQPQQSGSPATPGGEQQQPGSPSDQPASNGQPQSFTPEEAARGRELAQQLDALDRQMAASQSGQQPSASSLAQQQAQAQQQQMAAARSQQQQQSSLTSDTPATESRGIPTYDGDAGTLVAGPVNRTDAKDWGKLRDQSAKDLKRGRREAVASEYRKSVEAYFRVLSERARGTK